LVLIDGSDSSIATQSLTVSTSVGLQESIQFLSQRMGARDVQFPIDVRPKMLFNPDVRSANFMVPGLVAIILQVVTTLLTAFAIVRERERGTLEQLLVTPIKPFGLMLGKLVPYGLIGFFETCTVLTVMRVIFDVPINGSVALLILLSVLFLFTALAIGLLISTRAQNQVQAFQLAWLILLPSVLLSGFMFPRSSMPLFMQAIGYLIPATHFMEIIRGIVLRGATAIDLWPQIATLAVMGLLLIVLSALRFRMKIA
jgi:ABC-type multidrug transport system permease subunit